MKYRALFILITVLTYAGTVSGNQHESELRYSKKYDGYTVFYNAVVSKRLPRDSTETYGLEHDAETIILTVAVREHLTNRNISVDLKATANNLTQQAIPIEMSPVTANEMVSYRGTIDVVLPTTLTFTIEFAPIEGGRRYTTEFTDTFRQTLKSRHHQSA